MLALPDDAVAPYAVVGALDVWESGHDTVVEWRFEEDSGGEWVEGEGWMASLLPIRDELARGDYRSLYIGWLRSVQAGAWEDEEDEERDGGIAGDGSLEPPVPPGMRSLTAAQASLAEFLQLETDLIEAAAYEHGGAEVFGNLCHLKYLLSAGRAARQVAANSPNAEPGQLTVGVGF